MIARRGVLLAVALCIAAAARGEDVFLLRFNSTGPTTNACSTVDWRGDVHLFNQNPVAVDVRLLGISDGGIAPGVQRALTLPPGQVISLMLGPVGMWYPVGVAQNYLFVLHLDIPPGVLVESRDEVVHFPDCILPARSDSHAKVSLPIVRGLTEANVPQVKLGTDIGPNAAHENVAIYNGGTNPANAHIEVRRACDGSLAAEQFATIQPNSIIQVNGISQGDDLCKFSRVLSPLARYTVVTVDQPSFSIVSTVIDRLPGGGFQPRVDIGVR